MTESARITINSLLLLLFGSGLSFAAAWYWFQRNSALVLARETAADHQRTLLRIAELESKLALVNQAVIPISTAFQALLIKELTHFHTPEMDALMVKIGPPNLLTPDEEERLRVLLIARTQDMGPLISESERGAAEILPVVMKRARHEAEVLDGAEAVKLNMVTVATAIGEPNVERDANE